MLHVNCCHLQDDYSMTAAAKISVESCSKILSGVFWARGREFCQWAPMAKLHYIEAKSNETNLSNRVESNKRHNNWLM